MDAAADQHHFTYDSPDQSTLRQGDVLRRTEALQRTLAEVHPHYHERSDYPYFIVLTQSCDLVIRESKCKSRYVTIAAVRPLYIVVERELERWQHHPIERTVGFCNDSYRQRVRDFLDRLFNNNDSRYFFLRREPAFGMNEDYCAFLALSIALKAELHYKTLLDAKVAELKESFQHKLGHATGNLYSRVGTEDWVPKHASAEEFERILSEPMDRVAWIPKEYHGRVVAEMKRLPEQDQTAERLEQVTASAKTASDSKMAEMLAEIVGVLSDLGVDSAVAEAARGRLLNRPTFRAHVK